MAWFTDTEKRLRSRVLGAPFVLANLASQYEIVGRSRLQAALAQQARDGCGLVTVSNHLSLFDDPLVLAELLSLRDFTMETKCWWSTPCESNFNPRGSGPSAWFVRYFSDVSRMVFFARPSKGGERMVVQEPYSAQLFRRGGAALMDRVNQAADRAGTDAEGWLSQFVSSGTSSGARALNQPGMIEACARVALGDWLHLFPEGGRSRSLHLRQPRRGIGKILFHNPDALVVPLCFYGTQDIMPIGAILPRPGRRVVVTIGEPLRGRDCLSEEGLPPEATFLSVAERLWERVRDLRPETLARYLGPAQATALLRAEAPAGAAPAGEAVGAPIQNAVGREVRAVAQPSAPA